jgi:hypothetical protein
VVLISPVHPKSQESFSFRSVFYVVVSVICDSFNILCWCYNTSRIIKIKYGFDRDDCVDFTSCGGGSPDRTSLVECVTRNVFTIHRYVQPCLSKNPKHTFYTISFTSIDIF